MIHAAAEITFLLLVAAVVGCVAGFAIGKAVPLVAHHSRRRRNVNTAALQRLEAAQHYVTMLERTVRAAAEEAEDASAAGLRLSERVARARAEESSEATGTTADLR